MTPETFSIPQTHERMLRVALWAFPVAALVSLALPFLPESIPGCGPDSVEVSMVCTPGFALFTLWAHDTSRTLLRSTVTVDDRGIQPAVGAFVPWESIQRTVERPFKQRLDLVDRRGATLVSLDNQLADFGRLRALVVERLSRDDADLQLPAAFAKTRGWHVALITLAVGGAALGILGLDNPLAAGAGLLVMAFSLIAYLGSPFRVIVTPAYVALSYPLGARRIPLSAVEKVEMLDVRTRRSVVRSAAVILHINGSPRPERFEGMDTPELYRALSRVIDEYRARRAADPDAAAP